MVYHWQVMADFKPAAYEATAAAPFGVAVERVRPHTKLIGLLALGHFVIDCAQPPPTPWRLYFEERATFEEFAADFAKMWPTLPLLQYRLLETTRFGTPFALPD